MVWWRGRFICIFTVAFDILGLVNINDYPTGLEPPAGVRKRRKAAVKKQRNTAPGFKALDPKQLFHDQPLSIKELKSRIEFCLLIEN